MAMQQGGSQPYARNDGYPAPRRKRKKKKNNTLLFSVLTLVVLGVGLVIFQAVFNKQAATVEMTMTPMSN